MSKHTAFICRILPFALGGLVSLTIAQATDLGYQTLGNGPGSTAPIIGDAIGLLACGIAAVVAFRQIRGGALTRC
jgi:hypothetical protein